MANTLCQRCLEPLPPGALACDRCHTLVHAGEMERVAAQARALEAQSRLPEAHDRWLSILPLLPQDSKQAEWIRGHIRDLESAAPPPRHANTAGDGDSAPAAQPPEAPGTKSAWAKRLAPLGPIAVILAKLKTVGLALLKLKFLFSFATFIGVYWAFWGPRFGIGFAVLILIHEMGHFIDIKRRGLPADMPVFLPGLGAYVRWQALGVSPQTRAAISLAGPLAGCMAAVACALIWYQTRDPFWAALARVGAWFNVLNLIPVWIFDGASAAQALRKSECVLLMLASTGLGYATGERLFYVVAVGSLWPLLRALPARTPQPQEMVTLGIGERIPVAAPVIAVPENPVLIGQESHGIMGYFIAVLAGLAAVLWLVPGHGNGLP